MLSITSDTGQARELLDRLDPRRFNRAMSVAVNDTARQTQTVAARAVAKKLGVKVGAAKRQLRLHRSNARTLTATIKPSGGSLKLIDFRARHRREDVGATAKVFGTQRTYRGAFIATMKSGHRGVFVRRGAGRLPIRELYAPGIQRTLLQDEVSKAVMDHANSRLAANMARQIDRALRAQAGLARGR